MNQVKEPFADVIGEAEQSARYPFTTPGHKRRMELPELRHLARLISSDPPLLSGADDRRMSLGIREQAEKLAAEAYGADTAFFMRRLNGSVRMKK